MTSSRGLLFSPIQPSASPPFVSSSKNVRIGDAFDLTSIDNGIDFVAPTAVINYSRTIVTPANQELCVYLIGLNGNDYGNNSSITIDAGGPLVVLQNGSINGNRSAASGITATYATGFDTLNDISNITILIYTSFPQFTINVINSRNAPSTTPLGLRLTYTQIPVINPISNANFIGQLGAVYDSEIETPKTLDPGNTFVPLSQTSYVLVTLAEGILSFTGQNLMYNGNPVPSQHTVSLNEREVNKIEGNNLVVISVGTLVPTVRFIVTDELLPIGSLPSQGNPMTLQLNNFRPHLGNGPVTWNGFRFFQLQSGEEGIVMNSVTEIN